jgi:hypothetical protein
MKHFIAHWLLGFAVVTFASAIPELGIFAGFAWWFASCQIWRWRACTGRCQGRGRIGDPAGKAEYWRNCSTCGGRGRQLRMFCIVGED